MESIFSYQFFQNALIASLLTAVVCGVVGAYIVVRRIVFISGGITHASFGGIGLGLYLGIRSSRQQVQRCLLPFLLGA